MLADVGYDRLTMDAVATAAKASKATLYRRWNDKASLVIDALLVAQGHRGDPRHRHAARRPDRLVLRARRPHRPQGVAMFASLITAISRDEEFADGFRRDFIGPKIAAIGRTSTSAPATAARSMPTSDLDLLAPALAGIVLHRHFLLGEHPTPEPIVRVIDQIVLPAAEPDHQHRSHAHPTRKETPRPEGSHV